MPYIYTRNNFYIRFLLDPFDDFMSNNFRTKYTCNEHVKHITIICVIDQFCTYVLLSNNSATSRDSRLRECD